MRSLLHCDNEPMSAILHFVGLLLSIAGLVLLVVFASIYGSAWHVVSFSIFGASMVLLYSASTLYHALPLSSKAKIIFHRLDHAMIFILIAGTYTPICFITLRGAWGWSLFGVIWGLAITGITLKSCGVRLNPVFSTLIYLVMGWLAVIALVPLKDALPGRALAWLVAGGVSYSLGAAAFGLDWIKFHPKWFGMHEVFHLLVMLGSFCHFWLVLNYLV